MKIYVASGNAHKIQEFNRILASLGAEVVACPDFADMDVAETGGTFAENAAIKALALSKTAGGYVIADDSGLVVPALEGAPGIYSARYAGENASDNDNNRLLLRNLEGVTGRDACFVAVIALALNGYILGTFHGECEGSIAYEPRGGNGFGYDPLFVLPDGRTMAELSPEEKNGISHRRIAVEKLCDYLAAPDCQRSHFSGEK